MTMALKLNLVFIGCCVLICAAGCGVSDTQTISRMKAAMFIAELPEISCANCDPLELECVEGKELSR